MRAEQGDASSLERGAIMRGPGETPGTRLAWGHGHTRPTSYEIHRCDWASRGGDSGGGVTRSGPPRVEGRRERHGAWHARRGSFREGIGRAIRRPGRPSFFAWGLLARRHLRGPPVTRVLLDTGVLLRFLER